MARFCNKCNYPIEEGGSFCTECGSDDIRDEFDSTPVKEDKKDNQPVESTPMMGIPEIVENSSSTFGDRSISDMQASAIKPISNTDGSSMDTPVDVPMAPIVETPSVNGGSFVNLPDYMGSDINVPKDFQLQDGGTENDYSHAITNSQENNIAFNDAFPREKKKKSSVIKVVIIIAVVVGLVGLFAVTYSAGKSSNDNSTINTDGSEPFSSSDLNSNGAETPDVPSVVFTADNSFRVGDENYGYISIPNTWAQVAHKDGDYSLQYTDTGSWVVTLYAINTSQRSASDYANMIYKSIQSSGGQSITTGKSVIDGYPAFTISAYYETQKKYLTTWFFESKMGKTHYLAIEGPTSSSDNFSIVYSFKETK